MSHVLVTGGAGFIGSHLVEELLRRQHTVVVLDDMSGGFEDNIPAGAKSVVGSVTDVALVNDLFARERFDYVYHLAAYAAEGLSHFIKRFNYDNNLMGSITLINAAINHGVKCFVFTSSIAVYGTSMDLPLREEAVPRPEDSYGVAKLAVEHELFASKHMFDMDYIIFRPHNVYGERQNIGDKYRNVVGIFMNQLLQGLPMTVFGDGEQTRAFSHIRDMAPIMADAIACPGAYNQVFNIGADQAYSVNELAECVARAMGMEPRVVRVPARNETLHAWSAHDKIDRVFGSRPKTSLEDGLASMAAWVKRHGARESRTFDRIEVSKNFPKAWSALAVPAITKAAG
jgi:UDP-glucose 4-epimerase